MDVSTSSNPSSSTDGHQPFAFFIKQEKIDGVTQSDKILQFTLALQRQKMMEAMISQGNNDEGPLRMNRQPKTMELIDLTLSSDDEDQDDSVVTQSRPGRSGNGFPEMDDDSHDTIVREESSPGDTGYHTDDYVHSTVDEYEMDTAAPTLTDPHVVMYEEQRTAPRLTPNFDHEGQPCQTSTSAGKRPRSEATARPASVLKKSKNAMSPSPASVAGSSCSTSPREQLSSTQAIGSYLNTGTYPDKIEAQKGSPFLFYPNVRTYTRRNGEAYERSSFKCLECPYSVEKYETYLRHCDAHRIRRKFTCTTCSFSNSRKSYLERHLTLHMAQPRNLELEPIGTLPSPAPVPASDRLKTKLKNGQGLKLRTSGPAGRRGRGGRRSPSTGSRTFTACPKCPSKRTSTFNMQIHLKKHGKVGMRFTCPYCDYGSNRDDYIHVHIEDHLNSVDPDINTNPPGVTSQLASSAVPSDNPSEASVPSTSAAADGPPHLTEEDYELITGNPAIDYITISSNGQLLPLESSYKCWNCPHAATTHALLVAHQEGHMAKTKYGCHKCTYSAKTIQGLKNHELVHTVQHEAAHEPSTGQSMSFHGETSSPGREQSAGPSSSSLGPPPAPAEFRPEIGQFFITNIQILNIMAFSSASTVADLGSQGILKLKGNSEEGKSSYILAVMLGLGYDLCLDHTDEFTSICGLTLKNAITAGKDFGSVELTLSLRYHPELQAEYGSQIKFSRTITRVPSDRSNMLVITTADSRPQYKTPPKLVGGKELVSFLKKLKLSQQSLRLMLLDGENVKYMMDNTHIWYELYEGGLYESGINVGQKITETKYLLQRLEGHEKLHRERLQWFQSRLGTRPPMDSEIIRQVNEEDWTNHRNCTLELNKLVKEKQDLLEKLKNYLEQKRHGTAGHINRMRRIFEKFLERLNYGGEIVICEDTQQLAICIWKKEKEIRPTMTIDAVRAMWMTLSNGKRRIAVLGLYLALWEISSYLGFVAVDAFSCTEADFHVPPSCLPVLWEFLNRKCLDQKQCIISLPPHY